MKKISLSDLANIIKKKTNPVRNQEITLHSSRFPVISSVIYLTISEMEKRFSDLLPCNPPTACQFKWNLFGLYIWSIKSEIVFLRIYWIWLCFSTFENEIVESWWFIFQSKKNHTWLLSNKKKIVSTVNCINLASKVNELIIVF